MNDLKTLSSIIMNRQHPSCWIKIHDFELSHIVLLPENKCFVFGYLPDRFGNLENYMLLCHQHILNDLLNLMDEKGDKLLAEISQQVAIGKEEIVIGVQSISNQHTLQLTNILIVAKDLEEKSEDDSVKRYFVEEFIDSSNEKDVQGVLMTEMMLHLNFLKCSYRKYCQLLEESYTEKKARLLSGLKDPLLFQIACLSDNLDELGI